ncbi:hypothetical protein MiSe_66150 [Microseira wollei NIES-4236]|uniref:Transposase n=1 Tax=Microseira wollei NIES-4236 TaxID=2530354 RepID=A0AAV3XLY3_9CYAN|nr:hypothetical protein MiSe_66150 [Microseira wollei NIES-4236]
MLVETVTLQIPEIIYQRLVTADCKRVRESVIASFV